jgi:FAD-linked sulfhydryl oxidase
MNPKFWGPHGWIFLHSVTMNYPKEPTNEDKTLYRNFFSSLKRVLPCEKCAYHYKQHINDDPIEPALENRNTLVRWLIKIHNKVNEDLGKPQYTYEQVIEEYKYKMMNMDRDETLIYKVIIGALLLFILYKFFKK